MQATTPDVTSTNPWKRPLLGLAIFIESISFIILTNARFEGQGMITSFFRFSTKGDIISNTLYLFTMFLLLRAIVKPSLISMRRILVLLIASVMIFVVTLQARNFEVGEFPRIASITYLCCRALFLALLIPRREYDFVHLTGILQVLRNTILVLISAVVFAFIFSFTYTVSSDYTELKRFNGDAAVILGAAVWHGNELGDRPSPTLLERIKVGEDLLKRTIVAKVVATGGNVSGEKTEAEVAKIELIKSGIEENRVVAETRSHSTLEQVLFIRDELVNKQGWKRFIIISDQYHLARVIEMCKFNGVEAIGAPSNIKQTVVDLAYYRVRESVALLAYWIIGK